MDADKKQAIELGVAIGVPLAGGSLVGWVTSRAIPTWYATLEKPGWNPPNRIFAPAWTALYVFMGLASWLVWRNRDRQPREAKVGLVLYGVQLALNLAWSLIFFGLRRPYLALVEIIGLWVAVLGTIISFGRVNSRAAALLVPYQLWVTFAAALNGAIWWLNEEE
jgi:benzodiazapine receptor